MKGNTLFYVIYRNSWKIITYALGEHDPGSVLDWRTSSEMWALKRTNLDSLVLETKNYVRFSWQLNFPARDFSPLNDDFWNLLQKIDVLPFWDCLTSILEVKKTEWVILRQRNASSNVIYSPDLSLGCVISADGYIFETDTDLVNYSRLSHLCPWVFAIMKYTAYTLLTMLSRPLWLYDSISFMNKKWNGLLE